MAKYTVCTGRKGTGTPEEQWLGGWVDDDALLYARMSSKPVNRINLTAGGAGCMALLARGICDAQMLKNIYVLEY